MTYDSREANEKDMSLPPFPVPAASPRAEDAGEISPLGRNETVDLSRLSGFPQFNFGFDNNPVSPTAYDRRPSSTSQLTLMPNAEPPSSSSPPQPVSTSRTSVFASSLGPPLQPPTETIAEEEAPPPYTTFAEHNGRTSSGPPQPSEPSPAHTRPKRSGRIAFFHQRVASTLEIPGDQRMNTLTLDDLRSENRKREDAEARRRQHEAKQQWTWMSRGPWFSPKGDNLGFEQRLVRTEKRGMMKTRKWCLIGSLIVIVLVVAIVGSVVGGRSRQEPAPQSESSSLPGGPPALPLGTVVVRPFRGVQMLTTCVARPYIWSCVLPPDTKFPITTAVNDNFRVPEFRFIIKRRGQSDAEVIPGSDWLAVPRNVPNTTDYESVSLVDEVKDAGEGTDFYITLLTRETSGHAKELQNDYDVDSENNQAPRNIIKDESHMLPSVLKIQPLRLFDRGLDTEHYGFHIYFDKSVQFANNTRLASSRDTGGVSAENSGFRIMWNKTRFKVTIFTRAIGKVVETTADTELDLPVDIWEDRVGGDWQGRTITTYLLDKNGEPGVRGGIAEKRGVNTEKRGCFCHWSNYRVSSQRRL
ncbi:hypothetical protein K440DRAFT_614531 [Wilcoxina mikolae CBS 423.85]|nr:hypothetical protein K440DRAFT_614531 [Wilcoxina mikolae CBS 423.85]